MKTIKRILAIVLLIVVVILVGYLIFTGGQLNATETGGAYAQIKGM